MKIKNPEKRLKKFWGKVDYKHVKIIQYHLNGEHILDLGCGFGSTTHILSNENYSCIGIDYDHISINEAKKRYPSNNFIFANAEYLPFNDNYFDTIILRDALHHFYNEANFDKVKSEILRVSKSNARIIFFDPNINFLLKLMRVFSFHSDVECNFELAKQIMNELNVKVIHTSFNTVFSLPLSGGYVGVNFIPNIRFIHSFILNIEVFCEKVINKAGLGRYLCWRYNIVGERTM